MTVYKCDIYEIKKQVSLKYLYATHDIFVKLDDVRTRNTCFSCWTLCSSHYVRYPTHTINICCQNENRFVVVPFAANDVFKIMEINFTPGNFLIFIQFWYLLSIWPCCFHGKNTILEKFMDQCWAVKKLSENKVQ